LVAEAPTSGVDPAAARTLAGRFADVAPRPRTTSVGAAHDPMPVGFVDDELQPRPGAPVRSG